MPPRSPLLWAAALAGLLQTACSDELPTCRVGADCASGVCMANGMCQPIDADGGTGPDAAPLSDADPNAPDSGFPACTPNHDGIIRRDELPDGPTLSATFRVALDTPVNTAGDLQPGGMRLWNLAGNLNMDRDVLVSRMPLAGEWYESVFPSGDYAVRLSEREELLGVIEERQNGVYLLGVVSPSAGISRTELTYDPAVLLIRLPLNTNSMWSSSSTVSGTAQGLAALYTEDYDSRVDAVGEMTTPFGTFPVVRIATDVTRVVGAAVVTFKSFSFVSECYGAVATITSEDYETDDEPTYAAEVRRLGI